MTCVLTQRQCTTHPALLNCFSTGSKWTHLMCYVMLSARISRAIRCYAPQGQTRARTHHSPQLAAAASFASATPIYAAASLLVRNFRTSDTRTDDATQPVTVVAKATVKIKGFIYLLADIIGSATLLQDDLAELHVPIRSGNTPRTKHAHVICNHLNAVFAYPQTLAETQFVTKCV